MRKNKQREYNWINGEEYNLINIVFTLNLGFVTKLLHTRKKVSVLLNRWHSRWKKSLFLIYNFHRSKTPRLFQFHSTGLPNMGQTGKKEIDSFFGTRGNVQHQRRQRAFGILQVLKGRKIYNMNVAFSCLHSASENTENLVL